ncbi:amidohydrolase [Nesterenkonia alkaliphila]|uniref:Amidohydrolase family protein n=1 Tax=Nesterenkonia alkaliphila TaxID=1463631 RepID=A0A7K1UFQ7_9MICC|nr:amidohydrolase [Nesterenkonia alkaliphila]MVT25305.1 amidohydrolase family protein [Nesterenkonia alkaliphila]GFZ81951.1 amidohydrolase [Nesterenkonia alkaliphila]
MVASGNYIVENAHIVPVTGEPFDGALVVTEGKIAKLGPTAKAPRDHERIDAAGAWLLPGFVDAHVHLGVHEQGEGWAGADFNETTDPVTAAVRAIDAINPMDIGFDDALAHGVTTVNVNPGSANPIGGLTVAMKTHGAIVDDMVLRAPSGLKAALGENPKRVYGEQKKTPSTRLGTAFTIRKAFSEAREWAAKDSKDRAADLVSEALAKVLAREIPWRQHCHRADDIATAIRIADEFGYELVLDHGTEAHKLADRIAERGIPVLYGPMMVSRSKVEVRERSPKAPGILAKAGVKVSIITDHPVVPIDFLVNQAALAAKEGMDPQEALRAITINPAEVLGVADRIGSLEQGKDADLVLWEGDPLDTRNRALRTWIEGREVLRYDAEASAPVVAERW